ncbi:hypothetical protein M1D96_18320 [Pseudomonas sp. D1-3]
MTDLEFVMTDQQPPDSRQPAEPPILRDVVEALTPRKPLKAAVQKPARSPDESPQADQPERDGQAEEFLDKYDLSQVEEERRERRWARR